LALVNHICYRESDGFDVTQPTSIEYLFDIEIKNVAIHVFPFTLLKWMHKINIKYECTIPD